MSLQVTSSHLFSVSDVVPRSMSTSPLDATVEKSQLLARDYVLYRLQEECAKQNLFTRQLNGASGSVCRFQVEPEATFCILRKAAREVEGNYVRRFGDMFAKLRIEAATAHLIYNAIAKEVFRDGVNWGRICGLYSFAGAFAVHLVKKGSSDIITDIPGWVTSYIDLNLKEWIVDHGGWDGLVEHFRDPAASRDKSVWNNVVAVGGVLAGLALVAYKLSH